MNVEDIKKEFNVEEVWDTNEMQELFTVHSFLAPYVVVTRKADGVKGTLMFTHMPRHYFDFAPEGQ